MNSELSAMRRPNREGFPGTGCKTPSRGPWKNTSMYFYIPENPSRSERRFIAAVDVHERSGLTVAPSKTRLRGPQKSGSLR
jgi:hypothetical protein